MKCNRCSKTATMHITDIKKGVANEVHLCEECFKTFLKSSEEVVAETAAAPGGSLIKTTGLGDAELEAFEKLVCPHCKMTFKEFRSQGRLGCPQCYQAFREELVGLLENIHGETTHCGRFPKRTPDDRQKRYQLVKLNHELNMAIASESYEEAARLRDEIRELEHRSSPKPVADDQAE